MNCKSFLLLPVFLFCTMNFCHSQISEFGLGGGTFLYWGDLTSNGPVFSEAKLSGAFFYRYNHKNKFSGRFQLAAGGISGDDANNNEIATVQRNLHFRSPLYEVALIGEVELINIFTGDEAANPLAPYFFIGLAGYYFNPQAEYENVWYDLQPLGTSGQGLSKYPERNMYNLVGVSIPFGLHLKLNFSRQVRLGIDMGFRKVFTDNLDDVSYPAAEHALILQERGPIAAALSDRYGEYVGQDIVQREGAQRGNPARKDWYGLFQVNISYNFVSEVEWRRNNNIFFR